MEVITIEVITNSILDDIKKLLGIESEYKQFDPDLIIHINSAIGDLTDIGVGVEDGYFITGAEEVWSVFLPKEALATIDRAKMYIYFKVRLSFDPPSNAFLLDSMNKQLDEIMWRLSK